MQSMLGAALSAASGLGAGLVVAKYLGKFAGWVLAVLVDI
jgi:hypothetical protein